MWNVREVTERVRIGTQLLDQASLAREVPGMADSPIRGQPDTPAVPAQGADGTLLAVVPIPGTGTSLGIVGYPVTRPGAALNERGAPVGGRTGLLLDHEQRRVWADGKEIGLTFQAFEL